MTQKDRRTENWPFPDFKELSQHDLATRVKEMDDWIACSPLEITRVQGSLSTPYWQEYQDLAALQSDEWIYAFMAHDQELRVIAGYRMALRQPLLNRLDEDARIVSEWGRVGKAVVETRRFLDRQVFKNRYVYKP